MLSREYWSKNDKITADWMFEILCILTAAVLWQTRNGANMLARWSIAVIYTRITQYVVDTTSTIDNQSFLELLPRTTLDFGPAVYCCGFALTLAYSSLVHPDWILSVFITQRPPTVLLQPTVFSFHQWRFSYNSNIQLFRFMSAIAKIRTCRTVCAN